MKGSLFAGIVNLLLFNPCKGLARHVSDLLLIVLLLNIFAVFT